MKQSLVEVTERIIERSRPTRAAYLARVDTMINRPKGADRMGCANLAHAVAAMPANDKLKIVVEKAPNIGIITSYNEMLSAHQPYVNYPDIIRNEAHKYGATVQVAGGVPAMCDGVTQGTAGMELRLFSRDVIAMATAVSLSHDMYDAALMLGVCDKIVPGLLIGALHFGHLPTVFVPAGPMTSGLSNSWMVGEVDGKYQPWGYPFNWRPLKLPFNQGNGSYGAWPHELRVTPLAIWHSFWPPRAFPVVRPSLSRDSRC